MDILYISRTQIQKAKNMVTLQKEAQTKLTKGLLDLIVLQCIDTQPMHGYQVITKIRRSFGVYFGPSTIYPLLTAMEKKGQLSSTWNMEGERPRKVYEITDQGKNVLNFTENSLNLICKSMTRGMSLTEIVGVKANCVGCQTRTHSAVISATR
jgi:PadR family transcriptional regulator PadR